MQQLTSLAWVEKRQLKSVRNKLTFHKYPSLVYWTRVDTDPPQGSADALPSQWVSKAAYRREREASNNSSRQSFVRLIISKVNFYKLIICV